MNSLKLFLLITTVLVFGLLKVSAEENTTTRFNASYSFFICENNYTATFDFVGFDTWENRQNCWIYYKFPITHNSTWNINNVSVDFTFGNQKNADNVSLLEVYDNLDSMPSVWDTQPYFVGNVNTTALRFWEKFNTVEYNDGDFEHSKTNIKENFMKTWVNESDNVYALMFYGVNISTTNLITIIYEHGYCGIDNRCPRLEIEWYTETTTTEETTTTMPTTTTTISSTCGISVDDIDFASADPGSYSEKTTSITNNGNTQTTSLTIKGDDWIGTPDGSMPVGQTSWKLNEGTYTELTTDDVPLGQQVSPGTPLLVYFKLKIPEGQVQGVYTQTITFTGDC